MTTKTVSCVLLTLAVLAVPSSTTAGGLTVGDLPGSGAEDLPVCADSSTGRLGPCDSGGTAGLDGIAWVAEDGSGDYGDPVAAMDDLATWCGSPSLVNPCVLRIAPGHYSLSAPLRLADWVDVVGSGIGSTQLVRFADSVPGVATIIADTASARSRLENLSIVTSYGTANVGVRVDQAGGTLTMKGVFIRSFDALGSENVGVSLGEGHLELQDVTIQVDGTGVANGIKASAGSTLVSDHLTIVAQSNGLAARGLDLGAGAEVRATTTHLTVSQSSGASNGATGISIEAGDDGEIVFSGLEIDVDPASDGRGINVQNASDPGPPIVPRIRNAMIDASDTSGLNYGVFTSGGADVRITDSTVRGDTYALYAFSKESTHTVSHCLLDGGAGGISSAYTCGLVRTYDTVAALDSECQSGL